MGSRIPTSVYEGTSCPPVSCPPNVNYTFNCPSGVGTYTYTLVYSGPSCNVSGTDNSATVCVSAPSCQPPTTQSRSCPAGYTGSYTVTTSYSGASCTPSTSDDSGSQCQAIPSNITCPRPEVSSFACGSGYNGIVINTVSYTPAPNGLSCVSSILEDRTQCTPIVTCTTTTSQESQACDLGYTGNMTRTATTNSCTGTTYSAWDKNFCELIPTPKCSANASATYGSWAGGTSFMGNICPIQVNASGYIKDCFYAMLTYNDADDDCRPMVEFEMAETLTAAKYQRNSLQNYANFLNSRNP